MLERKLMDTGDKKVPAQRTPASALGASPFTFTLPENLEHQVNQVDLVTHAGPAGSRTSNGNELHRKTFACAWAFNSMNSDEIFSSWCMCRHTSRYYQ